MSSWESIGQMNAKLKEIDRQIIEFGETATNDQKNTESRARAATMVLGLQALREFYLQKFEEDRPLI